MKRAILILALGVIASSSVFGQRKSDLKFINENIEFAAQQTTKMLEAIGEPNGKNYPKALNAEGKFVATGKISWTPGFFPGNLWYLYELTGDKKWEAEAEKWTATLESNKTLTSHHDIGFIMYCSFGNAQRLASKPEYKNILVESAESLLTRYSEKTQAIKSWNTHKAWDGTTVGEYPVIIDNMMNLELLMYAYKATGEQKFYDVAVAHANSTLKNHIRADQSTYHVVNYDPETGEVVYQKTHQGYSNNSTWARGQAWAIYGFTMMYRETGDHIYMNAATRLADYFIARLPQDMIPSWDFNVGQEGFEPEANSFVNNNPVELKDASAAAIAASALFELGDLSLNKSFINTATDILNRLSSDSYRAKLGQNGNFLLMHSVGSLPHNEEVDVPLVYADYYFFEALIRYKNIISK